LLAYYDKTVIPEFVSTNSSYKASSTQDINAPVPTVMTNAGVDFDDFEILELEDDVTNEFIRDKVISIMKNKPNITRGTTKEFAFVTISDSGSAVSKTKTFYIFFGENVFELSKNI
jgi:hypothetical protein